MYMNETNMYIYAGKVKLSSVCQMLTNVNVKIFWIVIRYNKHRGTRGYISVKQADSHLSEKFFSFFLFSVFVSNYFFNIS